MDILESLVRYYDVLAKNPDSGICLPGYSSEKFTWSVVLSSDGDVRCVRSLLETITMGKKEVTRPVRMVVPQPVVRTGGLRPNCMWDTVAYALGIGDEGEKSLVDYIERFSVFRDYNAALFSNSTSEAAQAFAKFLLRHEPGSASRHPAFAACWAELCAGGNVAFEVEGQGFIHDDPLMNAVWKSLQETEMPEDDVRECLVTGEIAPIVRIHDKIKGVKGTVSTGGCLIGFNAPAFESFGRVGAQGLNAPISKEAGFKIASVLNYMLSPDNPLPRFFVGDTTVLCWTENAGSLVPALFNGFVTGPLFAETSNDGEGSDDDPGANTAASVLAKIAQAIRTGAVDDVPAMMDAISGCEDEKFYVLGLAPNAGRIAVRFFYDNPFGEFVENFLQHYHDMRIVKEFDNEPDFIPLWRVLSETVSKYARDKQSSPLMSGAVFDAMLMGRPYPVSLYHAILNRIRCDQDDKSKGVKKFNYYRMAVIKGYLTRLCRFYGDSSKYNKIKEVLTMSLNEDSDNIAYLLGRLFAVLEKAQQDAMGYDLNATIKDRYFSSACATPRIAFPNLMRLATYHIKKAKYGYISDQRIKDIMAKMPMAEHPFPAHLSLEEQGVFMLGYYHQRHSFYQKKSVNTEAEPIPAEESFATENQQQ